MNNQFCTLAYVSSVNIRPASDLLEITQEYFVDSERMGEAQMRKQNLGKAGSESAAKRRSERLAHASQALGTSLLFASTPHYQRLQNVIFGT